MRVTVALVLVCAAVVIAPASATQSGGNPTPTCNESAEHKILHRKTARKRWQVAKPLAETNLCIPERHVAKHMTGFRRWQSYRNVAPYRCHGGAQGFYAVPCYVVGCESRYSWSAYNSSGAAGVYQLMPEWGRPFPVRGFRDKLAHHRIAASLSLSNWVCA
jgi:hypothetical protein